MTHRSHRALLAAVAGASLAVSACGGGSSSGTTAARGSAPVPTSKGISAKPTGHFCADVYTVMRDVPSSPVGQKETAAMAQTELGKILRSSAAGYTAIEPEAPGSIRDSVKTIVSVYKVDARRAARPGSIAGINHSIVKADSTGSGGVAFRKVLTYIAKHCK